MENSRRVYIDLTTGKYHALFIGGNVYAYVIEDEFPAATIEIRHNLDSTALIPRIYTTQNEELLPNNFVIVNENTIKLRIPSPFVGKIKLMFFDT